MDPDISNARHILTLLPKQPVGVEVAGAMLVGGLGVTGGGAAAKHLFCAQTQPALTQSPSLDFEEQLTWRIEGCLLGWDDGCDVGQSEIEGCSEGWLLGAGLIDGDSDGIDDGQSVTDGASLGPLLG